MGLSAVFAEVGCIAFKLDFAVLGQLNMVIVTMLYLFECMKQNFWSMRLNIPSTAPTNDYALTFVAIFGY